MLKALTLRKALLFANAILLAVFLAIFFSIEPTNDANWSLDQQVLPYAELQGNQATIYNIRNFTYRSADEYTPAYYDKTFDLNKLKTVDFIVEPFSEAGPKLAHTFLSFGFEGNEYVSISIEVRKKKGQTYNLTDAALKQFELMYVIADERDVVKLRTNHRQSNVYLYRINTSPEKIRAVFVDMLLRANKLKAEPEFYNLITNTCTTNIVRHVNLISPERIPFSFKYLLPGYSDELAYKLGLIENSLPFEEVKKKAYISEKARMLNDDRDFSAKLRSI